ncbi:DMT family transporter [Gorillibacterium sp. sgz5001074]|uniref:DMT family transporter n=1 Tax=Gorillibacterium sp. sgz5001074 TaxID=3446695 RepID=UPI003F6680E6
MIGVFYSLLAGLAIAVQGIMNTKVSEKAGFWLTNALVHGSGFLVALAVFGLVRDGQLGSLGSVNKGYWLGGTVGVVIVYSVMKGIGQLGATYSIAILLVAQLSAALAIDSLGLFGARMVPFSWNKLIGIGIMAAGIAVLKWK